MSVPVTATKVANVALNTRFSDLKLDSLPGIGPATIKDLDAAGIKSVYRLLAEYTERGPLQFEEWYRSVCSNVTSKSLGDLIVVLQHKKDRIDMV